MKWYTGALTAFALNVALPVQSEDYDVQVDQQILDCLSSSEYQNRVVNYPYEGVEHPIRILYNPEKKPLWPKEWKYPSHKRLIMLSDLPITLAAHVEQLVADTRRFEDKPWLELSGYNALEVWKSLEPVYVAEQIDDPINNELARKAFSSCQFVNQILYYHVNNSYCQIRLLYNPEGRTLKATKTYNLSGLGNTPCTFSWNYKYGIFSDQYPDSALLDHLYTFTHPTHWEWVFNFDVNKGQKIQHRINKSFWSNTTTFYELDTAFEFAENFH